MKKVRNTTTTWPINKSYITMLSTKSYEIELGGKIAFFDVLVEHTSNGTFESSLYQKPTNTDLYIHWQPQRLGSWNTSDTDPSCLYCVLNT